MRVAECIEVSAPAEAVWEHVSDPARALDFMAGITRWEVAGGPRSGLGARYRMLMRVGSAEVGGLIEVVEFTPARDLAWSSVTGVDQRGRWRLRPTEEDGRTRVELRLQFGVAGAGPLGWVAEQLAAPTVRGHARRTLQALKREVEQERLRTEAAARRAARAGG
jgi:uncharacterized membrane protein